MGLLRLSLALAVVLFHLEIHDVAGVPFIDGRTAVFAFFVISGFYMAMVLRTRYTPEALGPQFVRVFYLSRFLRLFPSYAIVLAAALGIAALGILPLPKGLHWPADGSPLAWAKMIGSWASNVTLAFINVPSGNHQVVIGPAWSIGVELSFYAMAPFCLRWRWPAQLAACAVGFALMLVPYGTHSPLLFGFQFFMLGALAYSVSEQLDAIETTPARTALVCATVLLLLALPVPRDIHVGPATQAQNSLDKFIFPVLVGLAVPFLHRYTARMAVDNWIGRLSYPLYLVHAPVILVAERQGAINTPVVLALAGILSAALLELETRVVEPMRLRLRTEPGELAGRARQRPVTAG